MSRKLDAAIAEALGYWARLEIFTLREWPYTSHPIPHYSTDGDAMLELDREMQERGWETSIYRYNNGRVVANCRAASYSFGNNHSIANIEPLARALAAYKALTGKGWNDG